MRLTLEWLTRYFSFAFAGGFFGERFDFLIIHRSIKVGIGAIAGPLNIFLCYLVKWFLLVFGMLLIAA